MLRDTQYLPRAPAVF